MSEASVIVTFTVKGKIGDVVDAAEDLKNAMHDHFPRYGVRVLDEVNVHVKNIPPAEGEPTE